MKTTMNYTALRMMVQAGATRDDITRDAAQWAWRNMDRTDTRMHAMPGWPRCECASDGCDAVATTTDDGGNPVCAECENYACDGEGQPHCATHDSRVRDEGEWTGGGMHGVGTGWVSRYVFHDDDAAALCQEVAVLVGDDGTGDLGVIVRQALRDDPSATAEEIADIVREARADAKTEAARD